MIETPAGKTIYQLFIEDLKTDTANINTVLKFKMKKSVIKDHIH